MIELGWLLAAPCAPPEGDAWLAPAERAAAARPTLSKRRADWRAGRWTAKVAVHAWLGARRLGEVVSAVGASVGSIESATPSEAQAARVAIVAADDGAPEVAVGGEPASLVLSLSHDAGAAVAVVGPPRIELGVDLQTIEARSPELLDDFFTPAERAWLARTAATSQDAAVNAVWAAKEAALKALRVGLREDTRAVEVAPFAVEPQWSALEATLGAGAPRFTGLVRAIGGRVLVIVWRDPGA